MDKNDELYKAGLLESRHRSEECPSLADPAFVVQRQTLADMLAGAAEPSGRTNLNAL